jgi:hypothetical protein
MSLESKIEALTAAVIALTAKLESNNVAPVAQVAQAVPTVAAIHVAPVAAPVVAAAPVIATASPSNMPAPPTFMVASAPVAAVHAGLPFSDPKGLITYVMSAYTALGPQKGAMIQGVLTGLGYQNINDVKPEHYGQLFAGVEALKG